MNIGKQIKLAYQILANLHYKLVLCITMVKTYAQNFTKFSKITS